MDDAAVLPARPGYDLVISEDAMVEGVHFLKGEDAAIVARRLLRTNLSDLAAKAAEPFGYTLMIAWPPDRDWSDRQAFIRGLDQDGALYNVALLGGDTVATPGPLTVSATVLGWAPVDGVVPRSGALPGDELVVCGTIGDGYLGLKAARGEIADRGRQAGADSTGCPSRCWPCARRCARTRRPRPTSPTASSPTCCIWPRPASAASVLDLGLTPLSEAGRTWVAAREDKAAALLELASGGDDYAIVCAAAEGAGAGQGRRRPAACQPPWSARSCRARVSTSASRAAA